MSLPRTLLFLVCSFVSFAAGCTPALMTPLPPGLRSPYTGYASAKYRHDAMWLCRPDLPNDPCHGDLDATEIHPDGSRSPAPHHPAATPEVDCFYVYPTVDLSLRPANHTDFSDLDAIRRTTLAQAARFGEVCAVYVPLYRQVTIGTYVFGGARRERFLQTAFSDVHDAFLHYLGQYNHGRKVALIGHSQGAEMVTRLVQQVFDHDPALRQRLLVAMPIGGGVEVRRGQLTGGTFAHIPLCTRPEEPGCVVAFRTRRDGGPVGTWTRLAGADTELACTNPALRGGEEPRRLSRSYFPTHRKAAGYLRGVDGVTTPFVLYRDYYQARCAEGPPGFRYLGISTARAADERLVDPINLSDRRLNWMLGTHLLDMQFPQGDLIDLVARKAGRLP